MNEIVESFRSLFHSPAYELRKVLPELILIGSVVYVILRFLRGTRGARVLQGVAVLLVASILIVQVLANQFDWPRIKILYQYLLVAMLVTVLVVFQPELRRGLMRLGETSWFMRRLLNVRHETVEAIVRAAEDLSKRKVGALIAVERDVGLAGIIETGIRIDGLVSADLLRSIFWPGSPLHDMGVVIQENRVAAAGCQFPLAESDEVDRSLGSRHRAAIGLSHESDALVVVVSEETGAISLAINGQLRRFLTPAELREVLSEELGLRRTRRGASKKAA